MHALSRSARTLAEIRALLALATPIIIAQLAHTSMGFVDAVMAGRVSARDLAAVALGNSLWVPVFLLMNGTLLATTAKVAQRFGAGKQAEIGPLVRQALWLALAVGLGCATLLWNAAPLLHLMGVDAELSAMSMGYLRGIACGFPAVALYHVLRCCSDGIGHTRPSMFLGIGGLLLNIPLNYILIYGHLGFPAMGGVGCGWASGAVMWCMLLGMLWWVNHAPYYKPSQLFTHFEWPQWAVIRRLLSIGVPIGVAIFAESSIFSVIAMATTLLVYSALFQFSDAVQVTAAGALRGYQDTRATMLITLFAYWGIGLPVGYLLGLTDHFGPASGPNGLWEGLIAGLTCAALMLSIRLARSSARHIRRAGRA